MKWGVIPFWSKDGKMKLPTFNAKAETVTKLPTFKNAWEAGRRCLVVTDGFYEWRKGDKQPFAIACADGLTVMAGLWEKWKSPEGEKINSCTVITTAANELTRRCQSCRFPNSCKGSKIRSRNGVVIRGQEHKVEGSGDSRAAIPDF